jgi:hypothetical protein
LRLMPMPLEASTTPEILRKPLLVTRIRDALSFYGKIFANFSSCFLSKDTEAKL